MDVNEWVVIQVAAEAAAPAGPAAPAGAPVLGIPVDTRTQLLEVGRWELRARPKPSGSPGPTQTVGVAGRDPSRRGRRARRKPSGSPGPIPAVRVAGVASAPGRPLNWRHAGPG